MILLEHAEVWGFEHAVRGMRNPLNSWDRSDSQFSADHCEIGKNDRHLMYRLVKAGPSHRKFLRQIFVSVDITAPLYWWKEFDTYKVDTTANSCSTMHKIHAKEFTFDDFSAEHLMNETERHEELNAVDLLQRIINSLNYYRKMFLEYKDKAYWWQMIQLLPSSYNQKRTVTMTYENLLNMYTTRRGHKLDEWREFLLWVETLPHADLIEEGVV